jgi:hypothetical protein
VLAVRGSGPAGWWIRFGAGLRGLPNLDAHIAVAHHTDKAGTLWCVEGRPGGVGWRDARDYLSSGWTVTNAGQPKTQGQRDAVCKLMAQMIGTPYDWDAIMKDAADDLHLDLLWNPGADNPIPAHVVCSSLAAWGYWKAGLPQPAPVPFPGVPRWSAVQPGDWTAFILDHKWRGRT